MKKKSHIKSRSRKSAISKKSTQMFSSGEFEFLDYGKSIFQSGTTGSRRFLNDVYLSVSHYISESQKNAAVSIVLASGLRRSNFFARAQDLALADTWVDEKPNVTQIYNGIMDEALRKSKTIVLQAELIWIVTLSGKPKRLTSRR